MKLRYAILQGLLVAILLFSFGVMAGVFIENSRVANVQKNFAQFEVDLLDTQLVSDLIDSSDCELAMKENIALADRVFWEAKLLEKYEKSNEITDSIKQQHLKYDLLRVMIWQNSIKIKEKCDVSYDNVVYIYKYNELVIAEKSKQAAISSLLGDLKEQYGDEILLLSFAGDTDLPAVNLILDKYDVDTLPIVVVNEYNKVIDISGKEDIEKYLN